MGFHLINSNIKLLINIKEYIVKYTINNLFASLGVRLGGSTYIKYPVIIRA